MSNKYDYDEFEDYDLDIDFTDDLNTHKTKDKVKWIITAIAFVLVAVMLVALCLQVFGSGGQKPTEWFNGDEETESVLVITPQEQTAMRLNTARATASGNSYTITATVTPSDATNTGVYWSIAWKNGSSSWANGKSVSDYITLSSNDNSATVTLKTAFGEQAIITAASESNPEVTATCTVDYVERLSIPHGNAYMDVKRIYQNGNTDQTFSFGSSMSIKAIVQYSGVGTVRGDVEFGQLKIAIDDGMREYISSRVSGYNYKYTATSTTLDFSNGINTNVSFASPLSFFNFMGNPSETSGAITNAFIAACNAGHKIRMESTFTYSYDGTTIQSGQIIGSFTVNTSGLEIAVTGMSVDSSSVVF